MSNPHQPPHNLPLPPHITAANLIQWLQRREQRQQEAQRLHSIQLYQQARPVIQSHHQSCPPLYQTTSSPSTQAQGPLTSYQHQLLHQLPRLIVPEPQMTQFPESAYPPLSPPHNMYSHYTPAQPSQSQPSAPALTPSVQAHSAHHDISTPTFDSQQTPVTDSKYGLEGLAEHYTQSHSQQHVDPSSPMNGKAAKQNRLRKACDSCSIRKVKCDESGPPCKACKNLDIPCTFERPTRRRGPPNRHAEAIKRQRLEGYDPSAVSPVSATDSSPQFIQSPAASAANMRSTISAESICPIEIVRLLVDDYFTYVYPMVPFPHEPTFREAFRLRKDVHDKQFLAMLATMVGALVVSFPRRVRMHLKTYQCDYLFESSMDFVRKCHQVAHDVRGTGYLERLDIGVDDAATSYLMFLMSSYTYRFQQADLYLGECFTMLQALGIHNKNTEILDESRPPVDLLTQEIARRIYWTVFTTVRSAKALVANEAVAYLNLHPPTATRPHPPLPAEVDDVNITPNQIIPQAGDTRPMMTGFNIFVRIYLTYDRLISAEHSYAVDEFYDLDKQKRALARSLDEAKTVYTSLPKVFALWDGPPSRSPPSNLNDGLSYEYEISVPGTTAHDNAKRAIATEVQKANIHIALLSTRSFFVERSWSFGQHSSRSSDATALQDNKPSNQTKQPEIANSITPHTSTEHYRAGVPSYLNRNPNPTADEIRIEREAIANDVLAVLSRIRPLHMEANSVNFCMKIRQIAGTLLPSSQPGAQASASGIADGAKLEGGSSTAEYLRQFLEVLADLDKSMSVTSKHGQGEDAYEEESLRRWVNLRERQKRFVSERENAVPYVDGQK